MKNKECFYSSFIFLINAIVAYNYKYYGFSLCFLLLVFSSLFHHYYYTDMTYQIDRIIIIITFCCGALIMYNRLMNKEINYNDILFFVVLIFIVAYMYIYGYYNNKYSFDTDHTTSCIWHSLLHIIVSTGNIILVIL